MENWLAQICAEHERTGDFLGTLGNVNLALSVRWSSIELHLTLKYMRD